MQITHPLQIKILKELLFNPQARFSDLNKTPLATDNFNFHLKQLMDKELIEKTQNHYQLTPSGLELAGRLDIQSSSFVRQPKVGVSLYVSRPNGDKTEVLLGERRKNPNLGQIGFYASKVRFGEPLMETAARCLLNETGLEADFTYAGSLRILRKVKDLEPNTKYQISNTSTVIVDVLFTCFKATNVRGELEIRTKESINHWYTLAEAKLLPNLMPNTASDFDLYQTGQYFFKEINTQDISPNT